MQMYECETDVNERGQLVNHIVNSGGAQKRASFQKGTEEDGKAKSFISLC